MKSGIEPQNTQDTAKICANMVEKDDHDRYLTTLFMPAHIRKRLYALFAFNIEIAKTLENIKEPMISEIKLQWWREALEGLDRDIVRAHPVVVELDTMLKLNIVSTSDLIAMIDARADEVNASHIKTLSNLVNYCRKTAGALNRIAYHLIKDDAIASNHEHSRRAEYIGTAWGLTGIIRAMSFHASINRCFIPEDMMKAANISENQLYTGNFTPEIKEAIKPIALEAENHLKNGIKGARKIDRNAYLLAPITKSYLHRLKVEDYDIESVDFTKGSFSKLLRLTWSAMTARL